MLGLLLDKLYELHDTGMHPERSERLRVIREGVEGLKLGNTKLLPPVRADESTVALVHDPGYIDWVRIQVQNDARRLDPDTAVCRFSYEVALNAIGGSLAGIDAIINGTLSRAFFGVRPPGHHAERAQALGFCLFNNIAIAARHLLTVQRLSKVAIFDFDVHHGNGTMHTFYDDPSVFYSSVHQYPWYPGTGRADETGEGKGAGTTLNFPLPAGAGDDEYEEAVGRFGDAMERYRPEFLLVSAGFDGHWSDPLAGHQVTEGGYARVVRVLVEIARTHCSGRLAFFLEGGYNLNALKACCAETVRILAES